MFLNIDIHIFDYPHSQLFGAFSPVPTWFGCNIFQTLVYLTGDGLAYILCYSYRGWPMTKNYESFCKVSSKTTSV